MSPSKGIEWSQVIQLLINSAQIIFLGYTTLHTAKISRKNFIQNYNKTTYEKLISLSGSLIETWSDMISTGIHIWASSRTRSILDNQITHFIDLENETHALNLTETDEYGRKFLPSYDSEINQYKKLRDENDSLYSNKKFRLLNLSAKCKSLCHQLRFFVSENTLSLDLGLFTDELYKNILEWEDKTEGERDVLKQNLEIAISRFTDKLKAESISFVNKE